MLDDALYESILGDPTKRVAEDIGWFDDEDHSPAREFRVDLRSVEEWPLRVYGTWNPARETLSYVLTYRGAGRIVGLCIGFSGHVNPDGRLMSDPHKHRWSEALGDLDAYEPADITANWDEPTDVWRRFCAEVHILHEGDFAEPSRREEHPR